MSKQTGFLLVVLTGLTIFIAWSATEPNEYMIRPGFEQAPQPYPWAYLAWMALFSFVVIAASALKKPLARFIGALTAFLLGAYLVVILALSIMHSPPVHGRLLYVMFFSSLCLLFYSGYSCSVWRSKSRARDSAS